MKNILLALFIFVSFGANAQNTGIPGTTLYPHYIDQGLGTEASPYINSDSTAGIQTQVNILAAGQGGKIELKSSRYNTHSEILIDSADILIEGTSSGYGLAPNAEYQSIRGSRIIYSGDSNCISFGSYSSSHRIGNVQLNKLYLYSTTIRQSVGSSTGTVGVNLFEYSDQPILSNLRIGGFDYGIKLTNSSGSVFHDLSFFNGITILGTRIGVSYGNSGSFIYDRWNNCVFADNSEQNLFVDSSANTKWLQFNGCSFVRGSRDSGVARPSNVYFGGWYSNFTSCTFENAGYNQVTDGPQRTADGMILAGSYNSVTGNVFTDNIGTSSAGLRITGSHNFITGCTFYNNATDVIISGNYNTVYLAYGTTYTNTGTGNIIVTSPTTQWTSSGSDIYYPTGNVGIGATPGAFPIEIQQSKNSANRVYNLNTNTGSAATAGFMAGNGAYTLQMVQFGSGYTPSGTITPNIAAIITNNELLAGTLAAFPLVLETNGTERARFLSTGEFGVNVTAPTSMLQTTSFATAIVSKSANYTATISDNTILVTATGTTQTLPTAVGIAGREYEYKLTASGSATIATTSSQTIDGSTTYSLSAQYKYVKVKSDGANWIIIGNN